MASKVSESIKSKSNHSRASSDKTLNSLQRLGVVKKVTSELNNHIGIEDSVLAEFLVDIASKCPTEPSFALKLKEINSEFEPSLTSSLFKIVSSMLPKPTQNPKFRSFPHQNPNSNENETNAAGELSARFPGLAIKNTEPIKLVRKDSTNEEKSKRNDYSKYGGKRYSKMRMAQRERDFRNGKRARMEPKELRVNGVYEGEVTSVRDFGCFVRLLNIRGRRREGLVHISVVRTGHVGNIRDEVKRGQRVFVKVISEVGSKLALSMRLIDQKTGEDHSGGLSRAGSAKPMSIEERIRLKEEEEKRGSLNSAKARRRHRMTSPERWELSQLKNSGALSEIRGEEGVEKLEEEEESEEDNSGVEATLDIEVNDTEPPFLQNQTSKSLRLSPIRVVKNPDGSLSRAALTQSALAKERREMKEQARRAEDEAMPVDIARSWEDPMTPSGGRFLSQQLRSSNRKESEIPAWRRQNVGRNLSYGRVTSLTVKQQRESLPIFKLKEQLMSAIKDNDILVVIGATGSGKTTQMTQYLVEAGYSRTGKIGCTQPRRVAAMSVAKRVSEEFGCRLGQEVGYSIRFEDLTSSDTIIKYMTDGMLLREALLDKTLPDYSVVILDEAHERTVHTDVLFGLMKSCVKNRKNLKLIVTSATLDAGKFAAYFGECPIFTIPGRLFPTTIFYSKSPEPDYVDAAMMTLMQIHLAEPPGDILLFLTGKEEIDSACERLFERMRQLGPEAPELIILPVYSALPAEMQTRIFEPAPEGKRKCVIATNIAEASLTIDGIFYVVDPGFVKQKIYNAKLGLDSLTVTPISQASANQRAGRSGRTGPGQCYRLYTEAAFENEMLPSSVPEIQRTNLGNIVLTLKAMGINDLLHFDFMDPPPAQTLVAAMQSLYSLGALDDEGLLTRLGRKMAEFPLEPMQSKTLIQSVDFGCSEEVLTIVAMLSADNIWHRPRDKQALADSRRARFFDGRGDHLMLLEVYRQWERHSFSSAWCLENFIQTRAMRRAQDVRRQLATIMDRYRLDLVSCGMDTSKVRRAIASGFFRHVAKKDPQEGYKTMLEGQQVFIHPSSSLFNRQPPWAIYHQLVLTTKEYMREVVAVDPSWLVELAPRSFKRTDPNKISRQKRREKIEPLFQPNADPNAWRLSKRPG